MRYSPPTIIDKINERIPRKARIAVDLLLAAALLIGIYAAAGSPAFGEEARFRRAEKVGLVGPSELIDRMFLRPDWPYTAYNLLRIGDDGDQILFYLMRTGVGVSYESDRLFRREKTDGVLLTTLPTVAVPFFDQDPRSVPLLLFVDDPAAVRAAIRVSLSDGSVFELSQVRGDGNPALFDADEWIAGCVRERIFLFDHPLSPGEWERDWIGIMETNLPSSISSREWPAVIALYDRENQLIRTVDYTIRSRAGDAHAQ